MQIVENQRNKFGLQEISKRCIFRWNKNNEMRANITKIADLVKAEIDQIDKNAEVILFGSRARGDYESDSDWDFLILLSQPANFDIEELIRNKLYEIELETGQIITSIIEERSEWKKYEKTLIYKNIEEQGIPVT